MIFALNKKIRFAEELDAPYTVRAVGDRFAILTRPVNKSDIKQFGKSAVGSVIYTIADTDTLMRGPNNLVLNPYNYATADGIAESLRDLESGAVELSRRHSIPLLLADCESLVDGGK